MTLDEAAQAVKTLSNLLGAVHPGQAITADELHLLQSTASDLSVGVAEAKSREVGAAALMEDLKESLDKANAALAKSQGPSAG